MGNVKVATHHKKELQLKIKLESEISDGKVTITLPLRTVSELNNTDHWTKKSRRHRIQQKTVALVLAPLQNKIEFPCKMHFIRYAPRKLNKHDNLPASMKYVVDACCAILSGDFRPGRADDDENLEITYDQVTSSQYLVKVEFTF